MRYFSANVTLSTSQSIGYNVFTVDVTDPESDQITMSMTCDPVGCPFEIFDGKKILWKQWNSRSENIM